MSKTTKIIVFALTTGLAVLLFSIMFAEKGFLDLLRLKEQKHGWEMENSRIGLRLMTAVDQYKRLAKNDPGVLERLARAQGMIGKDELVLIPKKPPLSSKKTENDSGPQEVFRYLSDDEFAQLLNFDVESFKFYEELVEAD